MTKQRCQDAFSQKKAISHSLAITRDTDNYKVHTYIPWVPQCLSPRSNWNLPPSFPQVSVYPHPRTKGGDTRLRVRGWGSPNSDDWRKSLVYSMHIMEAERRARVRPICSIFGQQEPRTEPRVNLWWSWAYCEVFLSKLDLWRVRQKPGLGSRVCKQGYSSKGPQRLKCACTLQGKSHLCIPSLGIAQPQSQFPHWCVCERFIYSQDWSTYFPAAE